MTELMKEINISCTIAFICIGAFLAPSTFAIAGYFLRIPPSARANAMGGASINLVDEESSFSNPAALGLFHLNHIASFTVPTKSTWLEEPIDDRISLQSFSLSAGLPVTLFGANSGNPFEISFGGAFSRVRFDFDGVAANEFGRFDGLIYNEKIANSISLGIGAQYFVRLGIGVIYQSVKEDFLRNPVTASSISQQIGIGQFGIMLEAPLSGILPYGRKYRARGELPPLDLTLSVAHVRSLSEKKFLSGESIEIVRTGYSVYGALNGKHLTRFSFRLVYERELSEVNKYEVTVNRYGGEVGLFDIAYLRIGMFDDPEFGLSEVKTYGYGIRLRGILAALFSKTPASKSPTRGFIARSLDVRIDVSHYEDREDLTLGGTDLFKVSVSL